MILSDAEKKIWKILCFSSDDQLSMNSLFRRVTDNVSLRKTNNTELRWSSHGSMFLHSCESQMSLLWSILVGKNDKWIHIDYSFKITCLKKMEEVILFNDESVWSIYYLPTSGCLAWEGSEYFLSIHMLWLCVYRWLLTKQLGCLCYKRIYGNNEKLKKEGVGQRRKCGRRHS